MKPKKHKVDLVCEDCLCEVKPDRVILVAATHIQ